jgi:DivIVA domain-containing protein
MRKKETASGDRSEWVASPGRRITPAEIQEKKFGVARMGGGYRMREVDEFLDQVTETLSGVIAENEQLRAGRPRAGETAPPRLTAAADRRAVDEFLRHERSFLQSLGGLVQGHAEELKQMVRSVRDVPPAAEPEPAAREAPPDHESAAERATEEPTDAPPTHARSAPEEPAAVAEDATERHDHAPADLEATAAQPIVVPEPEAPATDEGSGAEAEEVARGERPIQLDQPRPASRRRRDEAPDASLRELFWGED